MLTPRDAKSVKRSLEHARTRSTQDSWGWTHRCLGGDSSRSLGSCEPPVTEGLFKSYARHKFQPGKVQVQTFLKWKFTAPGLNLLLYLSTVALIPKGIAYKQQ